MYVFVEKLEMFIIEIANKDHFYWASNICEGMESSAKIRGAGIAKRLPDYIKQKMEVGKATIAYPVSYPFISRRVRKPY